MADKNISDTSWKDSDINVESLWIINERDKTGKHKNIYHGNFIPQIAYQLIKRYTLEHDVVLEPFMGSGTTLFECENLKRKYVGVDINPEMIKYVNSKMTSLFWDNYYISICDSMNKNEVDNKINNSRVKLDYQYAQFLILHPPYMDIIKFTDNPKDLSHSGTCEVFLDQFKTVCDNFLPYLENNKYFALVIGDLYKKSEVIPLSFYCMDLIKKNFEVKLKGIIIKNIEGNRAKLGQSNIWKYRALKSDYYIFKHEYIFVFKKEF